MEKYQNFINQIKQLQETCQHKDNWNNYEALRIEWVIDALKEDKLAYARYLAMGSSIEDDYLKNSDKTELEGKISTVDSNYKAADEALDNKIGANTEEINNVSGRVKTIEDSYVKSSDYNEKVSDIDSSISDISSRLNNVKDVVDSIPENYQEKLVSGTNIKKINGEDILGEGNIIIQGGGSSSNHVNITLAEWEALSPEEKLADIVYFITDAENEYAKASDVQTVSDKVSNIEADYVKHEELPIVPDYTDKFNEIDSSISNVSTRVHNIENDYTTREYVD